MPEDSHLDSRPTDVSVGELRAVFEATNDAIFVHNGDGSLRDVNQAATELYGYDRAAIVDGAPETTSSGTAPYTAERFRERVQRAAEGESQTFEWQAEDSEGNAFWVEVSLSRTRVDGEVRVLAVVQDIDERKRREQAVEETTTRLQLALDGTNTGVWEWNIETDEIIWDERVEAFFGFDPGEFDGSYEEFAHRVHPADLPDTEEAFIEGLKEGSYEAEFRVTIDGDVQRWVHARADVHYEQGDPHRMVGIITDVTDRKEREQARRRFKQAVEQSGHLVYVTDKEGHIEYVNATFETVMGYDRAAALGETPRLFNSGEYDDAYYEDMWETLLAGDQWDTEIVDECADGSRIILDQTISPIETEDGRIEGFVAVAQDVTERKALEDELREYRQAVEYADVPIAAVDDSLTYLFANDAYREIHAPERAELAGRDLPAVLDQDAFSAAKPRLEAGLAGDPVEYETTRIEQGFGERTYQVNYYPIRESDGEVGGVVGVFHDVTARNEREAELEELAAELESQRDNLELLNQMVRHDIRNDLQKVVAYGDLLDSRDHVDADGTEHLRTILESARNAVSLTETARDLADVLLQADAGNKPVDLGHVIDDEVDRIGNAAENAVVTVEGPVPAVEVSANEMLDSVVRNLLKNAVQHNDKPIPKVTVSVARIGDAVRIRVADNGPGVPDEKKGDIFGKGQKGIESQGTGIGLYLVNSLVESYGGEVWIEDRTELDAPEEPSNSGDSATEGAVFVVELPKANA